MHACGAQSRPRSPRKSTTRGSHIVQGDGRRLSAGTFVTRAHAAQRAMPHAAQQPWPSRRATHVSVGTCTFADSGCAALAARGAEGAEGASSSAPARRLSYEFGGEAGRPVEPPWERVTTIVTSVQRRVRQSLHDASQHSGVRNLATQPSQLIKSPEICITMKTTRAMQARTATAGSQPSGSQPSFQSLTQVCTE